VGLCSLTVRPEANADYDSGTTFRVRLGHIGGVKELRFAG
jgi:hypothetical protein